MRYFIPILVFVFLSACVISKNTTSKSSHFKILSEDSCLSQIINGNIVDAENAKPIINASVSLMDTANSKIFSTTSTDKLGNFSLNITESGYYNLEVKAVAYNTLRITHILVKSNRKLNVLISLWRTINQISD